MNPHMEALGFTLVHFCWQAAVIAAAYKLAELLWPNLKPRARYTLGLGALLAMTLAALATLVYEEIRLWQATPTVTAATAAPLLVATQTFGLSNWLPWLDAAWLIGVLALTCRMVNSLWQVHSLKKHAHTAPLAVQDRFGAALRRFGLSGKVQVRLHPAITGPFVVGAFRSVVYLPLSAVTALSPAQLDAVLSHELEHIRRADYLWNLVQNLIETLFFYHPAVWWIGARLREQRELCCDDVAIHTCDDPLIYATALLNLEELRRGLPGNLAMALNGQGRHELLSRISRILGETPEARLRVRPVAFVLLPALLLTLTAFAAAPVTEAAGKIYPQKVAAAKTTATLALARVQEAITGQPVPEKSITISPAEVRTDKIEWSSQSTGQSNGQSDSRSEGDDIDPDAIAAEVRADILQAKADLANGKDVEIDPQALAADARAEAMKARAEMERQGIAATIDPDAIAAQVLAETQRAKADVARTAMANVDPDAIAAQARAAAMAAKAQIAAQKAANKAEWARQKAEAQRLKNRDGYLKAPVPPLPPVPAAPMIETPAPLAPPEPAAAPASPVSPLAPLAADWQIKVVPAPATVSKSGTLALVTLNKLPDARAMAIPSPDPKTDVHVNVHTRIKGLATPEMQVTIDTRH